MEYSYKLDLSYVYQQLVLEEEPATVATIFTHIGLYKHNHILFSVTTALVVFQQIKESLLQDVPCTFMYLDDILVTGKNLADHWKNYNKVLTRLEMAGMRLKKNKCVKL